jgi:hypothetical protein
MTKRDDVADKHLGTLLGDFGRYADEYDRRTPFDRSGQLSGHVRTIKLRRNHARLGGRLVYSTS